jgi:uncharacterized membrane protein
VQFLTTQSGDPFFPDAINDRGDIIGESPLGGPQPWMHWADGRWEQFTIPRASVDWLAGQAINRNGDWAGVYGDHLTGNTVAFFWSAKTGYTPIQSACYIVPFGMNDHGQVVGSVQTDCSSSVFNVFSWTPAGGFQNLGTFGGRSAFATSVNSHGVIAANINYSDHVTGVLISPDHRTTTPMPNPIGGVTTRANDVNDRGEVVGSAQPSTGPAVPVIWDANGRATVLPTPTGVGGAARISSNGIIIGHGMGADNLNHALVWMPAVPRGDVHRGPGGRHHLHGKR